MNSFLPMLQLQLMLFFIMILGVYATKKNYITAKTRKSLSDLLIGIILPCNIIASFQIEVTKKLLTSAAMILMVSFAMQFLYFLYSKLFYRKLPQSRRVILQYATICSNAGFLGLPIIGSLYGSEGVLYASIALIPLRIFMWSAGLSLFTKTDRKTVFQNLLTHPCIIAVGIGFLVLFCPYHLPEFLTKTIISVGNCTTTISMLVIGNILSEIKPRSLFDKSIGWYCLLRLLFIPVSVLAILTLLPIDPLIRNITVLLSAMPAGSTTAILAAKYNHDETFASQIIFVSTLLSLITLPLICLFL